MFRMRRIEWTAALRRAVLQRTESEPRSKTYVGMHTPDSDALEPS